MPLQVNSIRENKTRIIISENISAVTKIAVLVAVGLILFLFESSIPRPLPWLKPGLSNLVTILALYLYGFRTALIIMLLRIILGAFILGTLFNPVFIFGLSGGIVATSLMGVLYSNFREMFSVIGISILGACAHNFVQISLAAFLVINRIQALYLMPIMLLSALFSGFLIGIFAHFITQRVERLQIH